MNPFLFLFLFLFPTIFCRSLYYMAFKDRKLLIAGLTLFLLLSAGLASYKEGLDEAPNNPTNPNTPSMTAQPPMNQPPMNQPSMTPPPMQRPPIRTAPMQSTQRPPGQKKIQPAANPQPMQVKCFAMPLNELEMASQSQPDPSMAKAMQSGVPMF